MSRSLGAGSPKRDRVMSFLANNHGVEPEIVAEYCDCTVDYVRWIRRKIEAGHMAIRRKMGPRTIDSRPAYVPIMYTKTVIGPWTIDVHGNRSREIRGE